MNVYMCMFIKIKTIDELRFVALKNLSDPCLIKKNINDFSHFIKAKKFGNLSLKKIKNFQ